MWQAKSFIIVAFFLIVYNLGRALFLLFREKASSTKMVNALIWRISLSIILFLVILLMFMMGWIKPNGALIQNNNPAQVQMLLKPINEDKQP